MSVSPTDDAGYLHPEQKTRKRIDTTLEAAGWVVQDYRSPNLYAGTGVAVRELVTNAGPADYVLFVNRQTVGVIETKKKGTTLSGVEWQTVKYQSNIPEALPAYLIDGRLPYGYESTGDETWFTCRMDPEPTARRTFWFHRPETLERQIEDHANHGDGTLRARIPAMPALVDDPDRLRRAQFEAITNLERSLNENHSRALIQMATGSGKTFAAVNISERLIRYAQADRVLFLVDRGNLGKQTLAEFDGYDVPGRGRKFTQDYVVQRLTSNRRPIGDSVSVCIATIQRVYSMLRGEAELPEDLDEESSYELAPDRPIEVDYNTELPIEAFDVIIVDEW